MTVPGSVLKMRELLSRTKVIDELQLRAAVAHVERFGGRLPAAVVDLGFADEPTLTRAIGSALRVPVQPLGDLKRDADALARLDVRLCQQHLVFPVSLNHRTNALVLAMADPTALDVVDLVAAKVGGRVQPVIAGEGEILAAIGRHYLGQREAAPATNRKRDVVDLGDLELDRSEPPPVDAGEPSSGTERPSLLARPPSANTLLDEMLGDDEAGELSHEELARLGALKRTQEKTATILKALQELLEEKGYI